MNKATQRFKPREFEAPVKILMVWGFYLNLSDNDVRFFYDYNEEVVVRERESFAQKHGDKVSQVMKKPAEHLSKIGFREFHKIVYLRG